MPRRNDIKKIMLLGSGPIVIGQACEFDYSGTQACRALKEENYQVILVNSNPATIMTDPQLADATYIEPLHWEVITKIIEQERPDALLATMGGQTALNCALELEQQDILNTYKVQLIGAQSDAIRKAEDRALFDACMQRIGLKTPRSGIATHREQAQAILKDVGFPCIIRPSFTMGGSGGGIAYNQEEFEILCTRGFELSANHQILIDESLIGWKEYEMEVVRDGADNCIIVCSIENLDPMGVHTGDSITVAPAQTLTDKEFQQMRNASIAVLREIGVETGGSNVQFAINPANGEMVVIEMNPRVSRSSALASKATGFPIARVAAKLAVGYHLDELRNEITQGQTPISFEPTLDYVVTKIPRFNFEKFPGVDSRLTTQMKSVGEVMAIGRTFAQSFQKALRGLEIGVHGLTPTHHTDDIDLAQLKHELRQPGATRIFYVADGLRCGMSTDELHQLTHIDPWFLQQIQTLILWEEKARQIPWENVSKPLLLHLKRQGFADARLAQLWQCQEQDIRQRRTEMGIHPTFKRVDTCGGEFSSNTSYFYSTYELTCEARPTQKKKIIILGGGPNRIGQGIEFDYCCVHAAQGLKQDGYETIMINCNPETVSTDFDTACRLYFEPVTLEDVLEIVHLEKPFGVIVHYGGQTPLKLALALAQAGVPIIGTSPEDIDRCEDRARFQHIVTQLGLRQPDNATANSWEQAKTQAQKIGYPLVVRPSYVLGGRAMEVVFNEQDLHRYFKHAVQVSHQSPVLLDRFLDDAIEVDIDAIADGQHVVIGGIMEHVEQAGVHSGDSGCCLPPYSLSANLEAELRTQMQKLTRALHVRGLVNAQFAIKDEQIFLLEVNPRAARTIPFVSKAIGVPLAQLGARVMAGKTLQELGFTQEKNPPYFSVKEVVFPFHKFPGVDPILGPEMRSTGEVMGIGQDFAHAYAKAQLATNRPSLKGQRALLSVRDGDKAKVVALAQALIELGYNLDATHGTAVVLGEAGIYPRLVNKVHEGRPHILDRIKNGEYDYIVNTTEDRLAIEDSKQLRGGALMYKVAYTTTMNTGFAACKALLADPKKDLTAMQTRHQLITTEHVRSD